MNERKRRINETYGQFETHGIVEVDDNVTDPDVMHAVMTAKMDEFEADIETAYEDNKSERSTHLTKAAFLRLLIDGADDEQIRLFIEKKKLSRGVTPSRRRTDTIKLIPKMRLRAIEETERRERMKEYAVEPEQVRRIYDTLRRIRETGAIDEATHGALMVLFDTIKLGDDIKPQVITQLKFNAVSYLKPLLKAVDLSEAKRTAEGEYVLNRVTGQAARSFVTIPALAQEFAYDKDRQQEIPYSKDVVQNRRMIETYVSEALDILFPS